MGDHHILFGEVVGFYIEEDKKEMKPLSYWRGGYES
jgi:flavin reductase (DIM6/NTAB) family NADH-FMN oxidoreductase RutF